VPEVTVLITITITISLFPTGNIFQNMAAVMQHISAPVSHIKMSRKACPLIFTKTRGLLDLLFEELSFCMVLFINSLYTMDSSLIGVPPSLQFFSWIRKNGDKREGVLLFNFLLLS
jgi:hypothetical protein